MGDKQNSLSGGLHHCDHHSDHNVMWCHIFLRISSLNHQNVWFFLYEVVHIVQIHNSIVLKYFILCR